MSLSPGCGKEDAMPTTTDRDLLDMPVSDVRRITQSGQACHVVLLQEPGSGRRLPIFIGHETAIEIALRLLGHGLQLARPLGSDLTASLIHALGGDVREVRIDRLSKGTYYAVVVVDGPRGTTDVDARATPSRSPWSSEPQSGPTSPSSRPSSRTRAWRRRSPSSTVRVPPAPEPCSTR
jgi:bifunctional DNase/RNase